MYETVLMTLWVGWTIALLVFYHKVFVVYYTSLSYGFMKELIGAAFLGLIMSAATIMLWWLVAIIIVVVGLYFSNKMSSKTPIIIAVVVALIFSCVALNVKKDADSNDENTQVKNETVEGEMVMGKVDSQTTVRKLLEFTSIQQDEDKYAFVYTGEKEDGSISEWVLTYSSGNEFVRIADSDLTDFIGTESLSGNDEYCFSYDLSENEARIYLNVEVEEGTWTILSYNFTEEQFYVMVDGTEYYAGEELLDVLYESDIARIITDDVFKFKEDLSENNITFEEVQELNYIKLTEIMVS